MKPRVITRTHYQVDEPAYARILIRDCSSPTQSEYPERIARRLEERLKTLQKDFNLPAAKYCVDLARGLNLLTENNFWTWSAHVLRLITSEADEEPRLDLNLSLEERIFFFRIFLEYDGAALIFIASKILLTEKLPEPGKDWNDLANEMMGFVYNSYLNIITDVRDRADIRQNMSRRSRQPYKGKSGSHQCFVHLQAMARIGLLNSRGREYYKPAGLPNSGDAIVRLLKTVPDVTSLENAVMKSEWPKIAAAVFNPEISSENKWTESEILRQAYTIYRRVMATGVSLCSLSTVIETIQIMQIARAVTPVSYDDCMKIFRRAQSENPRKIRFKVDRIGRPAFIVLELPYAS